MNSLFLIPLFQDELNKAARPMLFIHFWTLLPHKKDNRCLHVCTTIASVFLSLIGKNNLLHSNNKTECNQMSLWSVILQ